MTMHAKSIPPQLQELEQNIYPVQKLIFKFYFFSDKPPERKSEEQPA